MRIRSSDSRPSASIRENRDLASAAASSPGEASSIISCSRARTATSSSDARRSRSISTASVAVASRCRRSCSDRRTSSAAVRSRAWTIRPAPQTARDSGTTNAAIPTAPGTPWTTDSVAPTNASPARSAARPARARPRGARVDSGKRIATATGTATTSRNWWNVGIPLATQPAANTQAAPSGWALRRRIATRRAGISSGPIVVARGSFTLASSIGGRP